MNISAWAIKNPVVTILMFIIISIIGGMSYFKLGINASPDVDFPNVVVSITQNGASPTELETEVTKKVEDALTGLDGLEHITSTVTDGSSTSMLQFKLGHPIDRALNDVRDSISKIRATLPQDINEPSITHPNFSGEPILTYSIESKNRNIEDLSYLVDNTLSREILTVPGVSQVKRAGGVSREIRVELNAARMRALGLTPDVVNSQLKTLNTNMPSGQGQVGEQEQTIRTIGSATSVEQLKKLQIPVSGGQFVTLEDLGEIND
ncbi:MAG: efflux RND transporter permease subunit, partial [Candidatus Sericytochromatia bacterium]